MLITRYNSYIAPEVLDNIDGGDGGGCPYGVEVDIWSVGVLVFVLLGGYLPFHGPTQVELFQAIKTGHVQFDEPYWQHISNDAKDFICSMLVTNPRRRLKQHLPEVAPVRDVFYEKDEVYVVEQDMQESGGDDLLFNRIDGYNEIDAVHIVTSLLHAVQKCHTVDVVHSNLTVYAAPEVVTSQLCVHDSGDDKRHYDKPADVWSVGVVAFVLLCGGYSYSQSSSLVVVVLTDVSSDDHAPYSRGSMPCLVK
ncbi:hypothetical protein DYB28_007957 [Aphanomyces astaci]|uniref:Protein kinase domain-containing protein n=1 Tax=Aphanomyces astaci TaxID=112090 RepID=A0A9X8H261_APHAT|nr:hypothetical protein DYB28_007957 [Aphanomyces astaci]